MINATAPETTPPTTPADRTAPAPLGPDEMVDAYGVGVSVRFPRRADHKDADQ